jgi:DNA-binding protein HU-beta
MTKLEVISKISEKTGIDKSDVQLTIENFFHVVQEALLENEIVHFKGFGKFINKKRSKKIARNLSDNTAIVLEAHYVPTLKISKEFIDKIKSTIKL